MLATCGARKLPGENLGDNGGQGTADYSVLEHHNGPVRTGVYTHPSFTRKAASGIHLDFTTALEGAVNAQPLFVDRRGAGSDLVLVATELNQVSAIDASTGALIWRRQLDPPLPQQRLVDAIGPCGNMDPIGITGTPIIDQSTQQIYFDLATPDDARFGRHLVYALSLEDGSTVPGWPTDVGALVPGFRDIVQNQRGALTILNGRVYIPYGGHAGDCADYRGWLVSISTLDPSDALAWSTAVAGAGIWGPSGVATDAISLFVATGNGAEVPKWMGSEGVLRLDEGPTFSGLPADYYAPLDWLTLDLGDVDLGGSGVILVDLPKGNPSELAVAIGKDGKFYVVDRSNLGGLGGALLAELVSGSAVTAPSAFSTVNGTFVTFSSYGGVNCTELDNIITIRINPTSPLTISPAWCASAPGYGSTMVTNTDGMSESIVWAVGAEIDNRLFGFDGDTGALIAVTDELGEVTHFTAPMAAKGRIYVAAEDRISAFTVK